MLILGIDPGTATVGYGMIRVNGKSKYDLLDFGWIKTDKESKAENRLNFI